MASHRRPKQPSRARATVLTATAAAAVALSTQAASADPAPDPNKKGVQAEVDRLHEEATQATEKYNGANEKAKKLQKQVDRVQDTVARGQGELNDMRNALGAVATAQYRSGGVDPTVQLILSADPDEYLAKAATLDQLSSKQLGALQKIQTKQRTLEQQRKEAGEKLKELADTRKELAAKKSEIQGKLAKAQRLLNTMTAKEKAAAAAEKAAEDARATRSSASARTELGNQAGASQRGSGALSAAQSKVGSPYVWGATGPNSFDCSGLTSWAFNQAGVSIPRTSQAQANAGTRINSMSDLRPGDLVLLRSDLSHVGFYAGNGQMLHAPKPGANVRYESISGSGMPFMWGVRIG
ncbi:NlpC/P60 family protein [Streptomyces sp. 549]|uniref:C40 family peptidase n=1 Tax=Streptomyces sp. 549 TaxID=3049076 RepID=UPI0024C3F6A1|nr:NlpC/P60 family protein [Streptomyces sp. 549]MDK1475542.1 NlpC/P60 family protein [Streptomyces sp. 549]